MAFEAFFASIVTMELRAIATHWAAARGAKRMPAWGDIDPVTIGRNLRYVWAWRYDAARESFIGRLAGEDIVRAFGKSPRGKPMHEFFTPETYEAYLPWHLRVIEEPAFLYGSGRVYHRVGRNFTGERIMLPLAENGTRGDGILGATYYLMNSGATAAAEQPGSFPDKVAFFPLLGGGAACESSG